MTDFALIAGIAITVSALILFGIVALIVLRRQGRTGRGRDRERPVPPPVDLDHYEPEQARDLNAEK